MINKKNEILIIIFEFNFPNNHSIYRFQILFGYSSKLCGGNRVPDLLFMSWFLLYDKNRKIFYKFCKNDFLYNIK